jgi:nitrogen fixation protein NifU and related proteins
MSQIYREELMEVYKHPAHKGTVAHPSVEKYDKNPMCGDEINLSLEIVDGVIKDAKFIGSACFVSIVSSEFLLEHIIGKTISEIKEISKDDLLKLINLDLTTSRIQCAMLVLNALQKAIKDYENK